MIATKIHQLKEQLFDRGIKAFAVFGLFALIGSLSRIAYAGWHPIMLLHVSLYLAVLILAFCGKHISYPLRVGTLSGVAFILGLGAIIGGGFAVFGLLVLGIFCILSTIFMGTKAGIVSAIINIIALGIVAISVHAGIIQYKYNPILNLNHSTIWIAAIVALAMTMGIVVVILGTLNRQMEDLAHTLQKQNDEITEKNRLLERDIAERIRMEEERRALEGKLQLAQKMETVGKLAGGVAHDLNNILGSVIGYPELMLMDLPMNSQLREPLETIKKTGIKAAAIVNDMLTLTRSGVRDANLRVSESSQATQDIAKEIGGVDHAAREMAEGSEQVLASATELSKLAEQLQTTVSRFRVSDRHELVLKNGIRAHADWGARLKAAIASRKLDIPVSTIRADNQCQFGKWFYGTELSAGEQQSENYQATKQLHAQFHEEAAKVAQLAISGQHKAAEKAMGPSSEYARISSALTNVLTRWSAAA